MSARGVLLYCTILYFTLYCTVLYYIVMYCLDNSVLVQYYILHMYMYMYIHVCDSHDRSVEEVVKEA